MRYITLGLIIAALFLAGYYPADAVEIEPVGVSVMLNGALLESDVEPVIISGRVLVPVRVLAESMQFDVNWDAINRRVLIDTYRSEHLELGPEEQIGLWVRGKKIESEVSPQLIEGRVLVPVRWIIRALGARVEWLESERLVRISTDILTPTARPYYQDRVVVLMYHHFADKEEGVIITPQRFAAHLEMLEQEGFNIVSLAEIVSFLEGRNKLPPNAVAITMDDGYESNYTAAYPLLKARGWPAAVFPVVSQIEKEGQWLPKLNWEQMEEMSRNGMSFYSHTYNSHFYAEDYAGELQSVLVARLQGETDEDYRWRVLQDLTLSRRVLRERLGGKGEHFSLPFGRMNNQLLELIAEAGYKYVWSIEPYAVTTGETAQLGRVNAGSPKIGPQDLKLRILRAAEQ